MAGSTNKKVILRRFDKETLTGYVKPGAFLQPAGIELLSEQVNVTVIPYAEVKMMAFVRDFDGEEQERQVFFTRPKMEGLWVNLRFRDGDEMEGIMPNNLLQMEQFGFTLTPPDSTGNRQKVFVPRTALQSIEVLGVVGSPLKRRKGKLIPKEQIGLFEE